jgi:hypothetical protein
VPVTRLLAEIRELGYSGSANLLVRYLNQGRAGAERAAPPPRRVVGWIMSRPADLPEQERRHLDELLAACPPLKWPDRRHQHQVQALEATDVRTGRLRAATTAALAQLTGRHHLF